MWGNSSSSSTKFSLPLLLLSLFLSLLQFFYHLVVLLNLLDANSLNFDIADDLVDHFLLDQAFNVALFCWRYVLLVHEVGQHRLGGLALFQVAGLEFQLEFAVHVRNRQVGSAHENHKLVCVILVDE